MKFKDLPSGVIFTYWEHDKHRTAIKIGEWGTSERERAVCLDTGEIVDVHHNKDVKEPEPISETLQYKVGHDGRAFLCSPISGGKVLARRILLIGGEFMNEENFKTSVSTRDTGREQAYFEQVYIMWNLLEKKLHDLNTLAQTVKMLLDDKLESGPSDNNIMSTSPMITGRALTE